MTSCYSTARLLPHVLQVSYCMDFSGNSNQQQRNFTYLTPVNQRKVGLEGGYWLVKMASFIKIEEVTSLSFVP